MEENDAEALAKLVQIDPELYKQCLDQAVITTNPKEAIIKAELLHSIESAKDSEIDDILPQIAEAFSSDYISKYLFGSTKFEATIFYRYLLAGSKEILGFLNEKFVSDIECLFELKLQAFSVLSTKKNYQSLDLLLKQNLEFFELAFKTNKKFRGEVIGEIESLTIADLVLFNEVISSESFLKKLININTAIKTALSSEEVTQEIDHKLKDFSIYNSFEISALLQKQLAVVECRPLCYDLILKGSNVILSQLEHLEDNYQDKIFLYGCFNELIAAERFDDLRLLSERSLELISKSTDLEEVKEEFASEILSNLSKVHLLSVYDAVFNVPNLKKQLEDHIIKLFSNDIKLGQDFLSELAFYQKNFLPLCSDYFFNEDSFERSRFFDILSSNQDLALVLFRDFCQEPKTVVIGEELLIYFFRERDFDSMQALLSEHSDLCSDILIKPEVQSQLKAICDNIKDADTIESLKAITNHSQFASLIQEFLNPFNREFSFLRQSNHDLKQFAEKEKAEFAQEFDALKSSILAKLSAAQKKHFNEMAALRQELEKEQKYTEAAEAESSRLITDKIQLNKEIKQFEKELSSCKKI